MTDFSSILVSADAVNAAAAVISVASVLAMVGFAAWGAKKVARFFDGEISRYRGDIDSGDPEIAGRAAYAAMQADPAMNKDLFVAMAREENAGGNLAGYSDAQVASYRDTFDSMPDDQARAYGAHRP